MPEDRNRSSWTGDKQLPTRSWSDYWPLFAAESMLLTAVGGALLLATYKTGGPLVYPLDDAYIHLTIAQNLLDHGVWGIHPGTFSSASSSIVWPLLIAALMKVTGIQVALPWILSVLSAVLTIALTHAGLRKYGQLRPPQVFLTLTLLLFLAGLPVLALTGMEHTLQTLATLCFATMAASKISQRVSRSELIGLAALSSLNTSVRFEGLFAMLVIVLLFLLSKRFLPAIFILVGGWVPVAVFGLYSVAHGGMFLPNSVLLKGAGISFGSLDSLFRLCGGRALIRIFTLDPLWMTSLLVLCTVVLSWHVLGRKNPLRGDSRSTCLLGFIGTTFLHLNFAETGWFYRYEGYLIAWGVLASLTIGLAWWNSGSGNQTSWVRPAALLVFGLCLFPVLERGVYALRVVPFAINNIFEQQYQMASFIRRYYAGQAVAVNDVGAVSFFGDSEVVDLFGVADNQTAKLARAGGPAFSEWLRQSDASIAPVYESWFEGDGAMIPSALPSSWTRVGTWRIQNNVVCGDDTVSWFAVRPSEVHRLRENLLEYRTVLPATVEQLLDEIP